MEDGDSIARPQIDPELIQKLNFIICEVGGIYGQIQIRQCVTTKIIHQCEYRCLVVFARDLNGTDYSSGDEAGIVLLGDIDQCRYQYRKDEDQHGSGHNKLHCRIAVLSAQNIS